MLRVALLYFTFCLPIIGLLSTVDVPKDSDCVYAAAAAVLRLSSVCLDTVVLVVSVDVDTSPMMCSVLH
jgi:hypothetical protein